MSFPLSSRFSEIIVASPSPTTYNIPSTFNEKHACSSWTKPASIGSHKCDDNCCGPICSRYSGECHRKCSVSKPSSSRRLSLNPSFIATEASLEKDTRAAKPRLSLSYIENKENIPSPQRKNGPSSIPRFRKNVTEGHSFSFVGRQRTIHNCFAKPENSKDFQPSSLNRNITQRTSAKQEKKNKTIDSIEQDSLENDSQNALNVSYTILPKIDEDFADKNKKHKEEEEPQPKQKESFKNSISKDLNITDDEKTTEVKPQEDDFITPIRETFNSMYFTPQSKLENNLSALLHKKTEELSNSTRSKKYYDISCKSDDQDIKADLGESETKHSVKSRDIFGISDCNFIFLIGEEFIDDDYDSYIENLNGIKGHTQVLQNKELYEMTRYLVRLYLNQNQQADCSHATSSPMQPNLAINLKKKLGKILNKRKQSKLTSQKANIWEQVEAIVKNAIEELKGEFRKEIYETTSQKLDSLISEIKTEIFNANESIDNICANKTTDLLSKLENIALKF